LSKLQRKSEDALKQLKNFYEVERGRLEARLLESKQKHDVSVTNLEKEYNSKISEFNQL